MLLVDDIILMLVEDDVALVAFADTMGDGHHHVTLLQRGYLDGAHASRLPTGD